MPLRLTQQTIIHTSLIGSVLLGSDDVRQLTHHDRAQNLPMIIVNPSH